jgi:hypothetical protein
MGQHVRFLQVDRDNPDPTDAINAFLWNMNKARSLGFTPSTEHIMAEHLFRGDVRLIFYTSLGGVVSIIADDDALDADDTFDTVKFMFERIKARKQRRKAATAVGEFAAGVGALTAQGIETRSAETPQEVPSEG